MKSKGPESPSLRTDAARSNDNALDQLLRRRRAGARVVRADRTKPLALSPLQEGLWFETQLHPDSRVGNLRGMLPLPSPLNEEVLVRTIETIVSRHEILRTVFRLVDGIPVQVIEPPGPFPVERIDLTGVSKADALTRYDELGDRGYDIERGPLFRAAIVRFGDTWLLWVAAHHLVFDGASFGIFMRELQVIYPALAEGTVPAVAELPIQYADCAASQRRHAEQIGVDQVGFWKELMAGATATRLLSVSGHVEAVPGAGARLRIHIDPVIGERIDQFVKSTKSTLSTVLLAAFHALLARWTGQRDLLVSTPVNIRSLPGSRLLIGTFVNLIPLRTRVPEGATFEQLVSEVRESTLNALGHADIPVASFAQGAQRSTTNRTLPRIVFALDPPSGGDMATGDAWQLMDQLADAAKEREVVPLYDLTVRLRGESGIRLEGIIDYDAGIFSRSTMESLAKNFLLLLETAVTEPQRLIDDLPITSDGEQHRERAIEQCDGGGSNEELGISDAFVAPRNPDEEMLAEIWRGLLAVPLVGIHDDFFALGGHSLLAIRLLGEIERAFSAPGQGIRIALRQLFLTPTVAALAGEIQSQRRRERAAVERPLIAATGVRKAKLLAPQRGTYRLDQTAPNNIMNRMNWSSWFDGPLDTPALERALSVLTQRHDLLRTRFIESEGELWQQIVESTAPSLRLERLDLTSLPKAEQEAADLAFQHEFSQRAFDLASGEVIRAALVTTSPTHNRLTISVHRVVCDDESRRLLNDELLTLWRAFTLEPTCEDEAQLRRPALQYLDLADYLARLDASAAGQQQRAYWQERVTDLAPLELPVDMPRQAVDARRDERRGYVTFPAGFVSAAISPGLLAAVERLARGERASVQSTLLAAMAAHLSSLTSQTDLAIVSHLIYRHFAGFEHALGLFGNPLIMRISTAGSPAFRELIARTHDAVTGAFENGEHDVLATAHHSLFRLWFNYLYVAPTTEKREMVLPPALTATPAILPMGERQIAYDLLLMVYNSGDRVRLDLAYNKGLFTETGASALLNGYVERLASLCEGQ